MQEVNPDTDIDALLKDFICFEDESKKIDEEIFKATKKEQDAVDRLNLDLEEAREELREKMAPYIERQEDLVALQEETKSFLGLLMGDFKTMDLPLAKIEKRVTRKYTIVDEQAVADILIKNGKVVEGVNTFNLTFVKGLVKAGVLSEAALEFKENENITVRRK